MPFLPPSLHFISPSSSGQRINFLFSFDLCYPYFFSLSPIREFYQVFPFSFLVYTLFFLQSGALVSDFSFREGVCPIPFATDKSGFFFRYFFLYFLGIIVFPNISIYVLFLLFWAASLLRYTYIRETGHIEILYSLVAIHGSNGRSGHMGFWEWETGFFLGKWGIWMGLYFGQ